MEIWHTGLPGVKELRPDKHGDSRGFLSETYKRSALKRLLGMDVEFVQDNHSFSAEVGTIRGLHFQTHPFAQAKLVRVVRGSIFDVTVDLRLGSPTYGHHVAVTLSAAKWNQLFVPVGFAHGFCTLEPDTEVLYKASAEYSPAHDDGIRFDDPALAIAWPISPERAHLSPKDRRLPFLADAKPAFRYDAAERSTR